MLVHRTPCVVPSRCVTGFFSNMFFLYAVGGSIVGQLLVVYFPPLQVRACALCSRRWLRLLSSSQSCNRCCACSCQAVFQTEALSFVDWLRVIAITCPVFLVDEVRKVLWRKRSGGASSFDGT